MKRLAFLLLTLFLAFSLSCCGAVPGEEDISAALSELESSLTDALEEVSGNYSVEFTGATADDLDQDAYYYDLEHVVLYLHTYGELPSNYITKDEAGALGWEGGSVEEYQEGAAIGGDHFGNREGRLPMEEDCYYTECDLDTNGADERGAKRLVFSDTGLYFYTEDHYETFDEVYVTEDQTVEWR